MQACCGRLDPAHVSAYGMQRTTRLQRDIKLGHASDLYSSK